VEWKGVKFNVFYDTKEKTLKFTTDSKIISTLILYNSMSSVQYKLEYKDGIIPNSIYRTVIDYL